MFGINNQIHKIKSQDELPAEYREIYDKMIMPVDTDISFDRVILSEENRRKIDIFLKETEYRDKLYEHGLEPMNRLLLYGASGTGKTFMTKALSKRLGYFMLYVDISQALADGNTVADNIHQIFKLANYLGECVIMMDEIDSIAWNRDNSGNDAATIRRATNVIFQHLDQMNHSNIFVSATNMLHQLDPAFERRFNMKMEFRRPDQDLMTVIHHFLKSEFTLIDDINPRFKEIVEQRAKVNVKLSYYEIEELVYRAMKSAILRDSLDVSIAEIYGYLAESMRYKVQFKTTKDDERIFSNPYPV